MIPLKRYDCTHFPGYERVDSRYSGFRVDGTILHNSLLVYMDPHLKEIQDASVIYSETTVWEWGVQPGALVHHVGPYLFEEAA